MKAVLYPNFQKKNALSCTERTCDILHDVGIEVYIGEEFKNEFSGRAFIRFENIKETVKYADVVIAVGGDGTILRCSKLIMGTDTKLLGINTGTLGFMAGLEADQLDKLSCLKTGEYKISERMTLDVTCTVNGKTECYTALNEVAARSASFRICDFDVYSDGYLVGKYRADGVLFSTPSGSTAYALSAGGPVIEPDLECIEMTQICPHSLFARATMFSPSRKLRLTSCTKGDEFMAVSIDGEMNIRLRENKSIEICRGRNNIKFIDLIGNSFHESLCKKLCKPIK